MALGFWVQMLSTNLQAKEGLASRGLGFRITKALVLRVIRGSGLQGPRSPVVAYCIAKPLNLKLGFRDIGFRDLVSALGLLFGL